MQFTEPRPAKPLAIRLTPLIDVVFILLVFFMLTTRLLPVNAMEVGTTTDATSASEGDPVPQVELQENGQLVWDGKTYSINSLSRSLIAAGTREIHLLTEPSASLNDFTLTFSGLTKQGITPQWKRASRKGSN